MRLRILVPFVVLLALVAPTDTAGNADGSPATHTWTISAPPVTCSTVTLSANADAWMEQNSPSNNKGSDSTLKVRSKGPTDNFRALVRFNLPAVPTGCVLESATLRMYSDSPKTGRTIQALQVATTWTEGGVTWSNQPATTGPAATVASGFGYREWAVTAQVGAMLASANHGFLLRDAVEGQDAEQSFHSREKGESMPQLVVRYAVATQGGATGGLAVCDAGCGSGPAAPAARVVIGLAAMLGLGVLVVLGLSRLRTGSGAGGVTAGRRAWVPAT